MNDTTSPSGLPGSGPSSSDVDPRFDDAAMGTESPRADDGAAATARSAQQQFADVTAAATEWVRGKPMQALAVAAGIGFLLGRSGR